LQNPAGFNVGEGLISKASSSIWSQVGRLLCSCREHSLTWKNTRVGWLSQSQYVTSSVSRNPCTISENLQVSHFDSVPTGVPFLM